MEKEKDIDPLGHSALIGQLDGGVIFATITRIHFFLFFFYLNLVILARFK